MIMYTFIYPVVTFSLLFTFNVKIKYSENMLVKVKVYGKGASLNLFPEQ